MERSPDAGFCNLLTFIFDLAARDRGKALRVRYKIPYADIDQLPPEELAARIAAGFSIGGFYEDSSGGELLDPYIKTFIATLAIKQYQ